MNARLNISILLTLLIMVVFVGCGESEANDIVLESKAGNATITVSEGAFNINADECITLLNEGIKEKGLQPISEKYDTVSKGGVTLYRSIIDKTMELRMFAYEKNNNAICTIQFARIDDIKDTDNNEPLISEDERNRTLDYYKVLTHDVDPRFNVDAFMRTGATGEKEYTLDNIFYSYLSYNQELMQNRDQVVQIYYVTTNNDLYIDNNNTQTDLVIELFDKDNGIEGS